MGHYIMNFAVYTLAMSGLIFLAVFIYKKVMSGGFCSKGSSSLEVEETMAISPRKSLMIVRAGKERFLVASDLDRTSLISKLDSKISDVSIDSALNNNEISKNLDIIIPNNKKQFSDYVEVSSESEKEPVHLELIKDTNQKTTRKRKGASVANKDSSVKRTKTGAKTKSRLDTMREMAKKINEI